MIMVIYGVIDEINEIMLPADNQMFKDNSRNTRTRCEICSKLTIKIPERRQMITFTEEILNEKCFLSRAELKFVKNLLCYDDDSCYKYF